MGVRGRFLSRWLQITCLSPLWVRAASATSDLSSEKTIQLAYGTSVVLLGGSSVPEIMYKQTRGPHFVVCVHDLFSQNDRHKYSDI